MIRGRPVVSLAEMREDNLEDFTTLCVAGHRGLDEAHRRQLNYLGRSLSKGMRGHVAYTPDGNVAGFYECLPLEHAPAALAFPPRPPTLQAGGDRAEPAQAAVFVPCFWVRDDLWGAGVGRTLMRALLAACEPRACAVVVGYDSSEHMQYTFFERFGFRVVESRGWLRLMVRPGPGLADDPDGLLYVTGLRWSVAEPRPEPDAVQGPLRPDSRRDLVIFTNDACPFNWVSVQRAWTVAAEQRDNVRLRVFDSEEDPRYRAFSVDGAVFLDGRLISHDPVSEEFLRTVLKQAPGALPRL